ncbi:hypothetical protein K7X08_010352 [Anisodus acutangulus]|uniref:Anaphase-promoting complex subunit 7 n=1 Tax=Anisodus acutangulus TaxID=402998 RepID=A0A9Q1N5F4_9SOLA|nr:hypothetical protein K7X08_010352 [Anisodus acutangulus]
MMGKLYRNSRHTRVAITCYKECLRHCPYIIEAIIALAELGVAAKDIISLFPQEVELVSVEDLQDDRGGEKEWVVDEATPLNVQIPGEEKDPEFDAPLLIHQIILKLIK